MANNGSRRGAVDPGTALMIVTFAVFAGFMYWLSEQSAAERALAIVVEDTVVTDEFASAVTVTGVDIQLDATPYEGRQIRLAAFNVASLLGTQGFWIEMPNGNPFLISMSAEVMAEGIGVGAGRTTTVTGTVYAMNDSTITAWTEAGTIQEGDRIVAEFATHYLEAVQIAVVGATPSGN